MTCNSFSENAKINTREVRPSTSVTAFVKPCRLDTKAFDDEPENWHTFMDSFACAIDKMTPCSTFKKLII